MSAIINITDDVQMCYGETLDHLCKGYDKSSCTVKLNDRSYNFIIVSIICLTILIKKLFDDIRKLFWQCFSDFHTRVFYSNNLCQAYKAKKINFVKFITIFIFKTVLQCFFWIVNQSCQLSHPGRGQFSFEGPLNFGFDYAGSIFQNMKK